MRDAGLRGDRAERDAVQAVAGDDPHERLAERVAALAARDRARRIQACLATWQAYRPGYLTDAQEIRMIRTTAIKGAAQSMHVRRITGRAPGEPHERRAEQVRCTRSARAGAHPSASCCSRRGRRRAARSRRRCSPRASRRQRRAKSGGTMRVGIGGGGPTDNFDAALINGPSATTRGQVYYETLIWLDGTFGLHNWLCDRASPTRPATSGRCASSRASSSTTARRSPRTTCSSRSAPARPEDRARPPPRSSARST